MTYTFKCDKCGHIDDKNVSISRRLDTFKCHSCGEEAFKYDEMLTLQGQRIAYVDSPLSWAEKNNMPTVDMAAGLKGFGRRTAGVHRVIPGLPGHEGGESKREL